MRLKCSTRKFCKGISTFPGKPYHINTDPSIPPKWLPCQPVPVHQQDEFKKQLNDMLDTGVIIEVHEATPWINSFVIAETVKDRNKKLRICLDPEPLNKAIMHQPYITCTPDDVYHKLANAKYITVIDFKKSFWQFVLDEESSYLTMFNTPFGCYHYLRMPFGTSFLGMCNFLSKFSPRMAEISESLCQLTCKGIPFIWGPEHTEAFQLLKREISTAPILQYYDPKKPVVLQADACTKGLGAVLLQHGHPVYFAFKSLTAAQKTM